MRRVHRREVLRAMLGLPFASSAWALQACERGEARPIEGELLGPSIEAGHRIRDRALPSFEGAPVQRTRVAILGGGVAGLAAAWRLRRRGIEGVAVYELERTIGGTARGDEVPSRSGNGARFPWGAHYVPVPRPENRDLTDLLVEAGALARGDDGRAEPAEHVLVREPETRVFYGGYWYPGLYPYAGADARDLDELRRFEARVQTLGAARGADGRPLFALPVREVSDDERVEALDREDAASWLRRNGFRSERLRWLVDYACRDDYGLTAPQTSAWAALFYWAARFATDDKETAPLLTWPEGNARLTEHLATWSRAAIHRGHAAVAARETETGVTIDLLAGSQSLRVEAERCISALPRFIARRVVSALGDEPSFRYGAWVVANLHLRGRPASRGHEPAWDNVLYDSPSLGYVVATHQTGRDAGPTVWTYYLPLTNDDPADARRRLLELEWSDWRDVVIADLARAHPSLLDHLERIDVFRWGHAMIQPRPGFFTSETRRRAASSIGRIHFAAADLSGLALFEEAFAQGVRAADEVADALGGSPA